MNLISIVHGKPTVIIVLPSPEILEISRQQWLNKHLYQMHIWNKLKCVNKANISPFWILKQQLNLAPDKTATDCLLCQTAFQIGSMGKSTPIFISQWYYLVFETAWMEKKCLISNF